MKFPFRLFSLAAALLCSCSINKMAINAVSNALTQEGSSDVFTSDPDSKLVGEALPFAIKMYESLLNSNPGHQGLMLTTGSLFVMYANAFVQGPAELLPQEDYRERREGMERAKNLYLRGTKLLYDALDKKYPGFSSSYGEGKLETHLQKMKKDDVALLYWTVAGSLSAYSLDVFDFELGSRIPELGLMIARAYELNPDFNNGALDEFYILYYASLPEVLGGDKAKAEKHFNLALEKTKGGSAGTYVSYAQAVCIPAQDYEAFKINLEKALDVDVNAEPSTRLVNILSQRKARYLLKAAHNYFSFLPYPEDEEDY